MNASEARIVTEEHLGIRSEFGNVLGAIISSAYTGAFKYSRTFGDEDRDKVSDIGKGLLALGYKVRIQRLTDNRWGFSYWLVEVEW